MLMAYGVIWRAFFLAVLLSVPAFLFAQEKAVLKGTVRDAASGMSLIGATVVDAHQKGLGTAADLNGNFKIDVPAGRHKFICSFIGYVSDTLDLKMEPGGVYTHDFSLQLSAISMGPVVVSASKYEQRLDEVFVTC